MKIVIDFDGTLCKREGIPTSEADWENLEPMEGAVESVKLLQSLGHEVLVLTSNPQPNNVHSWLEKYKFPHMKITNIKEPAQVYIDDRAIRFTNWQDIRKYFT